eukprot:15135095-Alexandrium_andersonii.AAC.1
MGWVWARFGRSARCASARRAAGRLRSPRTAAFVGGFGVLREKWRRAHPSGDAGTNFEVFPGSAQFKL